MSRGKRINATEKLRTATAADLKRPLAWAGNRLFITYTVPGSRCKIFLPTATAAHPHAIAHTYSDVPSVLSISKHVALLCNLPYDDSTGEVTVAGYFDIERGMMPQVHKYLGADITHVLI